ncbi:hypothetical protein MAUB1S_07261 [Mycolicibacterium aubagnense]
MKNVLILAAVLLPLAACSQTERGAAIGGLGGAAVGAAVAGNPVEGAVIGGAVGTVAGALIGNASERGKCRYRDRYGRVFVDRCPDRGGRYYNDDPDYRSRPGY